MVQFSKNFHEKHVTSIPIEKLWKQRDQYHLIDVRTPDEFMKGTIPGAINLPLLSREHHSMIGKLHRAFGQTEAISVGYEELQKIWPNFIKKLQAVPISLPILVFCYQGRMRSRIMANIFLALNYNCITLEGGYKRFRSWNLEQLNNISFKYPLYVLDGLTGVGKTNILLKLNNYIDLEGLAQHRSSVFGAIGKQPVSTKTFEAKLLEILDQIDKDSPVFIEGESRKIGNLTIPKHLFQKMKSGRRVLLTASIETRVKRIAKDYLPHTQEEQNQIADKIKSLTSLLGKKTVTNLLNWLEEEKYTNIIEFLLREHYDKKYKNTMKNYQYYAVLSAENENETVTNIMRLK